jgi:glucan biosynthesis protein C
MSQTRVETEALDPGYLSSPRPPGLATPMRTTWKVLLVSGVVVGHATMAWTGIGTWVLDEPPVREPLLSLLTLVAALGALFAVPAFSFVAGVFTPRSLRRKGLRRFLVGRALRLGLPMVFYIILLSPIIEYADPDAAGWDGGFGAFTLHIWWPPAPGPTWFLGVLLVFSFGYAIVRAAIPSRPAKESKPRAWSLGALAGSIALASYLTRFAAH